MLLTCLIACKTTPVYIFPEIAQPPIPEAPEHDPWTFVVIDENTVGLSVEDSKILATYLIELKEYADRLKLNIDYYIKVTDYSSVK